MMVIKYIQFLITKFRNSLNNLFDFSFRYNMEENIRNLLKIYGYRENTKLGIILCSLYEEVFLGDRPYETPVEVRKLSIKYYKIIKPAYLLVYDNWCSEKFNAEKIIKIMIDILYLKKDELDKIDGYLPVT